jgi:hypothetical protein
LERVTGIEPARDDLRTRVRRARPLAEIDGLIDQRLDPQPPGKCRRQHNPAPATARSSLNTTESDRPVSMHHEGDLLRGPDGRHQS